MTFEKCWLAHGPGDYIAVFDGKQEPSVHGGPAWWAWRSHNFIGRLVEKTPGTPRKIGFELAKSQEATVSYLVCETIAHEFTLSDVESFQNNAIGV